MRGGCFGVLGRCFAGDFGGGGGGANGRFCRVIPRFLGGARVRRGDSAHGGQCRVRGAKKFLRIFKKRGEKSKIGGARGTGRWCRGTLYRVRGAIFGSGNETSGSVARDAVRFQRFAPLIYRGPVCKPHHLLYGGISACPTCNSLTLTCGLRAPAYRTLVIVPPIKPSRRLHANYQFTTLPSPQIY